MRLIKFYEVDAEEQVPSIVALLDEKALREALKEWIKFCKENSLDSCQISRQQYGEGHDYFVITEEIKYLWNNRVGVVKIHFEKELLPNIPYEVIFSLDEIERELDLC